MEVFNMILKTCLIVLVAKHTGQSLPVGNEDKITDTQMDGKYLINMGAKLESPLFNLLGKTFVNTENAVNQTQSEVSMIHEELIKRANDMDDKIEELKLNKNVTNQFAEKIDNLIAEICLLHPCTEWSDWSQCDAIRKGTFGSQARTRKCGYNSTLCVSNGENSRTEKDIRLCEYSKMCPSNYELTEDDFCIKLYADEQKSWHDSQKKCSEDGGHLISISSESKSRTAVAIFERMNVTDVWIDGMMSSDGDWEFSGDMFTYRNWYETQPDGDATSPTCVDIYNDNGEWKWWDSKCSAEFYFMCEI